MEFGKYLRVLRENRGISLRKLALNVQITASYLSQVESDLVKPPAEETIKRLASALGEHPDVLLAMAGRTPDDLKRIIAKRPLLIGELLREIDNSPDNAVIRIVREVRDGKW